MTTRIPDVGEKARAAAKALENQTSAFDAERNAEVALLREILRLAGPALPTICGKLPGHEALASVTGSAPLLGVELFRGGEGAGLVLLQDGTFAEWQGGDRDRVTGLEAKSYVARSGARFLALLDLEDVVDGWGVADVARDLSALFDKQTAGRGAKTEEASARAAKIRAVALLLA